MTAIRFQVNEVFDIAARPGLVVGSAEGGFAGVPRLHDELTGRPITVLGVDFPTPRTLRTGETILLVDRADAGYASAGRVWVG
ncbi:hypothetical protein AB0F72_09765 [Actinoplanes sp. NPDC023936]|uniref:hypothetical protein n=1 Tax=Actinoplanes sp. NPDC023936 TaxID=3154910 RepID=UPI0033DFA262